MASRGRRKAGTPMSIVPPAIRQLVEDGDLVTGDGQLARDREIPAGPAPTTATVVSRGVIGGHVVRDARRLVPLHEEPLHGADGQRPVDIAAAAGTLAGRRADVGAHGRDRVGLAGQDVALLEPPFSGEVQVAAAVRADGARFLALDVALQPGGVDRLNEELLVRIDGQTQGTSDLWEDAVWGRYRVRRI